MQEDSSRPFERRYLSFSEFLTILFDALATEGVRPYILRNYEQFPASNTGGDVDIMIAPRELPLAIRALRSMAGMRMVGYVERHYAVSVFLEGVVSSPELRAMQVDFIPVVYWKGMPFVPTDALLATAIPRSAGELNFFVPSPVYESILSLLSSLLVGGWLKEKYFPKVQQVFLLERTEVIGALIPQFGLKTAMRLVDAVIGGHREEILNCIMPLRSSLVIHSLLRSPLRTAVSAIRHYAREFSIRFLPTSLETVCVLDPIGNADATIVEGLMPILQSTAKAVEKRSVSLSSPYTQKSRKTGADSGIHRSALSCSLASMVRITHLLAKEWMSRIFGKKNLTLRLSENHYYGPLIYAQTSGGAIPAWFARLILKLLPSDIFWILLDQEDDVIQTKHEPSCEDRAERVQAYRSFVETRKRHVILDASRPEATLIEDAYDAIIDMLAQQTSRKIERRFL